MDITTLGIAIDSRQVSKLKAELDGLTGAAGKTEKSTKNLTSATEGLSTALKALGIAYIAKEAIQTADAMALLEARLKLVVSASDNLAKIQKDLVGIAKENRTSIQDVTVLYTKLSDPLKQLGVSTQGVTNVTNAFSKALLIGGASVQEASAVTRQFAQAMASGVLRGDEFNAMAEASPEIMKVLQKELGKTQGEIRKMAEEGKLTSGVVSGALLKSLDDLTAKAAKIPLTVGSAFQNAKTDTALFVDELNKQYNITGSLASAIQSVTESLKNNKNEIKSVVGVIVEYGDEVLAVAGAYGAVRLAMLGATTAQLAFNTAAKANPYVIAATALGTAIYALNDFANSQKKATDATQKAFNTADVDRVRKYGEEYERLNKQIELQSAASKGMTGQGKTALDKQIAGLKARQAELQKLAVGETTATKAADESIKKDLAALAISDKKAKAKEEAAKAAKKAASDEKSLLEKWAAEKTKIENELERAGQDRFANEAIRAQQEADEKLKAFGKYKGARELIERDLQSKLTEINDQAVKQREDSDYEIEQNYAESKARMLKTDEDFAKQSADWAVKIFDINQKLTDDISAQYGKMYGESSTQSIEKWYQAQLEGLGRLAAEIPLTTEQVDELLGRIEKLKSLKLTEQTLSFKVEQTFFNTFENSLASAIDDAFNGKPFSFDNFLKSLQSAVVKTIAGDLASSITGGLKGALGGGISSTLGGSSFGSMITGSKAVYDIATAGSYVAAPSMAVSGINALWQADLITEGTASSLLSASSSLAAAMPYLTIAAVAAPAIINGLTNKTTITGTGVSVGTGGALASYQDIERGNWFGKTKDTGYMPLSSAQSAPYKAVFESYDKLLSDLFNHTEQFSISIRKYSGTSLIDTDAPKQLIEQMITKYTMGIDGAIQSITIDKGLLDTVFAKWQEYALSTQQTVNQALGSVLGENEGIQEALRGIALEAKGLDGAASIAIEAAGRAKDATFSALDTVFKSIEGFSYTAADVTAENFELISEALLKANPSPEAIAALNAYGAAMVRVNEASKGAAGKALTAEAQSVISKGSAVSYLPTTGISTTYAATTGDRYDPTKDLASIQSSILTDAEKTEKWKAKLSSKGIDFSSSDKLYESVKKLSPAALTSSEDAAELGDAISGMGGRLKDAADIAADAIKKAKDEAIAWRKELIASRTATYKALGQNFGADYMGGKFWGQQQQTSYFMRTGTGTLSDWAGRFDSWLERNKENPLYETVKAYRDDFNSAYLSFVSNIKALSDGIESARDALKSTIQGRQFELYASGGYSKYASSAITEQEVGAAIQALKANTDPNKVLELNQKAQTSVELWLSQQTALAEKSYNEQIKQTNIQKSLLDVSKFASDLSISELGYKSPLDKAAEASQKYEEAFARLRGATTEQGAATAAEDVQKYATAYLENLKAAGTYADYKTAFDSLTSQMSSLKQTTIKEGDTAEVLQQKQLDATNKLKDDSLAWLTQIDTTLKEQQEPLLAKLEEIRVAIGAPKATTAPTVVSQSIAAAPKVTTSTANPYSGKTYAELQQMAVGGVTAAEKDLGYYTSLTLAANREYGSDFGMKVSSWATDAITKNIDGSHANGLGSVPYDGYIAQLHSGEEVRTSRAVKDADSVATEIRLLRWDLTSIGSALSSRQLLSLKILEDWDGKGLPATRTP